MPEVPQHDADLLFKGDLAAGDALHLATEALYPFATSPNLLQALNQKFLQPSLTIM